MATYDPTDPSTWAGYAPAIAMGDQQEFIGNLCQDELPPDAANPVLWNAYTAAVCMNQIIKLWKAAQASAQYQQIFTCLSGDVVGEPVYLSGANAVTLALGTSKSAAAVLGFIASKPTPTSCLIVSSWYVNGLIGLPFFAPVYLSNAGAPSAIPGTYPKKIGIAISTTEALLFANPLTAIGEVGLSGTAQLIGGTVTVNNPLVAADSVILLAYSGSPVNPGILNVGTITPGTSFVIQSSSGTDGSYVNWLICN